MKIKENKVDNVLYFPVEIKIASISFFLFFNTMGLFALLDLVQKPFSIIALVIIFACLLFFVWTAMLVCDAFRKFYFDEVKIWSVSIISQPIFMQVKDIVRIELQKTNPFFSIKGGDLLVLFKESNIKMFGINTSLCNYEDFYTFICKNTNLMKNK